MTRLLPRLASATAGAALLGSLLVPPAEAADPVSIAAIQGTGAASPLVNRTVSTAPSVVTAVYGQGAGDFQGFVIQTPGSGGPGRDLTRASDAVFVYLGSTAYDVRIGDAVTVTGTVAEFKGLTELTRPTVTVLDEALAAPRPVVGVSWTGTAAHRENLESMLYASDQAFTVADTYPLLPYGELALAGGRQGEVPVQPTDAARPRTAAAAAQAARNDAIAVGLDDGTGRGYRVTERYPARQLPYLTRQQRIRVGDSARLTEPVIIDYRNEHWTFQPVRPIAAGQEIARISHVREPAAPRPHGAVTVASFNVLNFFTTTGEGRTACVGGNLDTTGSFNVATGCDVRGAWDRDDRRRQRTKIVTAINGLDAAVTGLMEIENSIKLGERRDEALASLVHALNADAGYRKWAFVGSSTELQPVVDQDFITSALIYQPARVSLRGQAYALGRASTDDGAFGNARTPIAASFAPKRGGKPVLVVVNHFKSKGSPPDADEDPGNADRGDGQGSWNASRVAQAKALLAWLPSVQRRSRTSAVALVGDFNAYAHEDPITALAAGGFRNAAPQRQFSYVYDGLSGSLDHVLLNRAARSRLSRATVWNINSGQSAALEYSQYQTTTVDYYRADAYRSSDHDPVIAGLSRR